MFLVFQEKVEPRSLWNKQPGQSSFRCHPRSTLPAVDLRRDGEKQGGEEALGRELQGRKTPAEIWVGLPFCPSETSGVPSGSKLSLMWRNSKGLGSLEAKSSNK